MRIAIGSDEAGLTLKNILVKEIERLGHIADDVGVFNEKPVLYPDIAKLVVEKVASSACDRGVLICGTGIGMSITANKYPGIRAALAHDAYSAERAVKSNNAQILTMGARVIGPELAKVNLKIFLESHFIDGPSTPKVNRISELEREFRERIGKGGN